VQCDVLVVGGGAAGCVLAARLSQQPHRSVVLIEAGPDFPDRAFQPEVFKSPRGDPVFDPAFSWQYDATVTSDQDQPLDMVRGRVIGGSSAINGSEFIRGIAEDYDSWGSELWTYPQALTALRAAESDADFTGPAHGSSGPIPVRRVPTRYWTPLHEGFYEAAIAAGFPEKPDINQSDGSGVGPTPMNVGADGIRVDTAIGYLDPVRHRSNLTIRGDAVARKVIFDQQVAIGVEIQDRDGISLIEAGEIVLSCGAIATPHLLMASGVGPADHLRSVGVPVVQDLPGVGQNLRDHPIVSIPIRVLEAAGTDEGAASSPVLITYTAPDSEFRNDMLLSLPWRSQTDLIEGMLGFRCRINLSLSSGEIRLKSAEPTARPDIHLRYFEEEEDRRRMRECVRLARDLARQPALRHMIDGGLGLSEEVIGSDTALDAWLRQNAATEYHSCGTCRMGSVREIGTVVDDHCRVRGVEALRVVDNSIAPDCVRANTCSTAVMIAERAAEIMDSP
jgi:choline dehydrogenase